MKENLQALVLPASIAASFLIGCSSAPTVTARTDPKRPSIVQVQEGYDTFGRKWGDQTTPAPVPPPEPVPVAPAEPVAVGAAPQPEAINRSDSMVLNYTGTITDIDYANREMTLKNQQGRLETFAV